MELTATEAFGLLFPPRTRTHRLEYDGATVPLFKLWILNILLCIPTLGIYNFWGKTKIRRYINRSVRFDDDRFEYTGHPHELFKGFGIAFVVLSIIGAVSALSESLFGKQVVISIFFSLLYLWLWYFGWYSSLRYRASRTTWKAIRGRLTKEGRDGYIKMRLKFLALNFITLGLHTARADRLSWEYVMDHASFGTQAFTYLPPDDGHRLFTTNWVTILLFPFTLGLSRLWYVGNLLHYKFNGIGIAGVTSMATFKGSEHLGFVLVNWLLTLVTLGFARPYVINRKMRYLTSHITFHGTIDTAFIHQSQEMSEQSGEGLDDILGIDIGFI